MVPTRTYESAEGPCREYSLDAEIGGKTEQVYGTACRQPDGSWRIVD
jgi:surface antigen